MPEPLLEVKDLHVSFPTEDGVVKAVDGVSFSVMPGESLGVVGESGSGKSVTFLTVMGLVRSDQADITGEILYEGQDLLTLPNDELQKLRGAKISMIFQDPLTSLHPFYKVGDQIAEVITTHEDVSKKEAFGRAVEMLDRVRIAQPDRRAKQYPHEFSGGMRQRAMIAMALALNPDLLIADEPTTALDVTVQAQILDLIDALKHEFNAAVAIVTHDLGVVAEHCEHIQVMYAGKLVESGRTDDIYYHAQHPYTWGLLSSIPELGTESERLTPIRGLPPSMIHPPSGCAFHPRCPYAFDRCKTEVPELRVSDGSHAAACHLSLEDKGRIFTEEIVAHR
ncbi:MAG TPA: ABC transporter ATP-binding protein [Actinomycetota bacterium]|nr:ABC transporter ATP-binding protein [Actinomycetota bacterium]